MKFYTKSYLNVITESNLKGSESFSSIVNRYKNTTRFDVFLSHSYQDKPYIKALFIDLTNMGLIVYVDWIIDSHLDRKNITKSTVDTVRRRMIQSKSLIYATSDNASSSKWMPWELGFVDGNTRHCAILPIKDSQDSSFVGQEFLSAYPYVTKENLYSTENRRNIKIHESKYSYSNLNNWLS